MLASTASAMAKKTPCPVRGRVSVTFVVNEEGGVEHARTIMGIHEACDAVAERAMSQMRFTPATLNETPVKLPMMAPITFK